MKGEQQLTISGEVELSPEICFSQSPQGVLKVDTADHFIL